MQVTWESVPYGVSVSLSTTIDKSIKNLLRKYEYELSTTTTISPGPVTSCEPLVATLEALTLAFQTTPTERRVEVMAGGGHRIDLDVPFLQQRLLQLFLHPRLPSPE